MAWKNIKIILFFLLIANGARCECDSYSSCVGSFVSDFFGTNYFKNIKSLNTGHGENDLNNILANVSSFLQTEVDNDTIVSRNVFRIDNDTSVLVRAINIGEDIDFYNFDENQTLVSPEEFSVEEFLPGNASSILETINRNSTFQPLVFNFSKILVPVNFNTTLFPQIKIEHYEPERDQRENEISDVDFQEYYDYNEDNSTDYPIIDYIDLYKDTTNEISNSTDRYDIDEAGNEQNNEEIHVKKYEDNTVDDKDNVQDARAIFPWIAALYIKNDTDDQFNYYCDGALLSNKTIVTAARCIRGTNHSVEPDDIIVLLGKNSLQATSDNERVSKVDEVYIHDNFTGGSENDIAVLSLEDEVELSESIHPARLGDEMEYDEAYTTGWAFTGELSAIHFQQDSNSCNHYLQDNETFCAAYGNEVSVCPSYGGLFAVQANSTWYLQGIRTADPTERAICINRPVVFTALEYYYPWLSQFV